MEHVSHLQSEQHMSSLYKYKGDKEKKRIERIRVKQERKAEEKEKKQLEREARGEPAEPENSEEEEGKRSSSRKRSKKDKKRSKKDKRKKKKKKRYSSSSDSYSDSEDSDAADREARYDAEKRARKLSKKFGGGSKTAGLAAEVRIAVAQAEARARDLQRDLDDKAAKDTNVFGKAQDRIKSEAEKEWGVSGVKTEAELLTFSEHKAKRGGDDDEDFMTTMNKDKDLMDEDEDNFQDIENYDKDEIEIIPEKVENKPRTKLSFIAPRIPVNRKAGFGSNTLQSNQGADAPAAQKNAGGLRIAAGGAGVSTSAAFQGSNVFATVTEQEQARFLQAEIAAGMTGTAEIHDLMKSRAREHELMSMTNTKSDEQKLQRNAVKMNILDSFKAFTMPIPDYAKLGQEPVPCGMAMPGYAYDVGDDGNEAGTEVEGHDDFDFIDIRVY